MDKYAQERAIAESRAHAEQTRKQDEIHSMLIEILALLKAQKEDRRPGPVLKIKE